MLIYSKYSTALYSKLAIFYCAYDSIATFCISIQKQSEKPFNYTITLLGGCRVPVN